MTKARPLLLLFCLVAFALVVRFGRGPVGAQTPTPKPIFLAAGEGRRVGTPPGGMLFKLGGGESASTFEVATAETKPSGGPPLHVHDTEDEAFFVVSGTFRVKVADQTGVVGPGGFVFAPRGLPHAYVNIGTTDGRLLVLAAPATFEAFWREITEATRGMSAGTPEFEKAAAPILAKHKKRIVGPPLSQER